MARILFSELISNIRGKVGTAVFQNNTQGTFLRSLVIPHNRASKLQQISRSNFAYLTAKWASQSNPDRATWIAATANFPYFNIYGQERFRSGFQLFMLLNSSFRLTNQPILNVAPNNETATDMNVSDFSPISDSGVLTSFELSVQLDVSTFGFFLYASPMLSAGTMGQSSRHFRLLGFFTSETNKTDFISEYLAAWGTAASPLGRTFQVRVIYYSLISGQRYMPFILSAECT